MSKSEIFKLAHKYAKGMNVDTYRERLSVSLKRVYREIKEKEVVAPRTEWKIENAKAWKVNTKSKLYLTMQALEQKHASRI